MVATQISRRKFAWTAFIGLVIAGLGVVPAYMVFWNRPDLVYEQRIVPIPVSERLRQTVEYAATPEPGTIVLREKPILLPGGEELGPPRILLAKVPDRFMQLVIQNLGTRPSESIVGTIKLGGILDYKVEGPNPAYGSVSFQVRNGQIDFQCPRLAQGDYQIKILVWFLAAPGNDPDVGVVDSRGPVRFVDSIAADKTKWGRAATTVAGVLVALLGIIAGMLSVYAFERSKTFAGKKLSSG